jgi:hypothetical protein
MTNHQTSVHKTGKPGNFRWLHSRKTLKWLEVGLAAIGSLAVGILFAIFAKGGPNSSDITLYMNVGLNGIKMPFILNRYFHVFLQAIFLKLAPSPLQGYHLFWGFIMGLNICLIYLAARKVLKHSNILHGVLAVLVFFSFSAIAETAGVIVVDFTAMTMITVFFFIYLLSLNQGHHNPWLVGALGAVLYLAFKTKETTLPVAVLLIGLGWVNGEKFNLRRLLLNALWVLCGGLVGVVCFGILSWIFLGDPFFGLRISEWREFLDTYAVYSSRVLETMNALGDGNFKDWYQGYWFEFSLLPFLFYLISGIKLNRKVEFARKLLWLVPLTYTLLLIISINNRLGYEIRFGLPVLPILAMLVPQFIDLQWPKSRRQKIHLLLYSGVGLAIAIGIRVFLRLVIPAKGLDLGSVVILMYYPILITVLFASLFLFREKLIWQVVNALILISLMISPVTSNLRSMFIFKENQAQFTEAVLPFIEFEDEIDFDRSTNFYFTYDVFDQHELKIGKNVDELVALFNVYFDASATRQNFTYQENPLDISDDLLSESYDYALITMDDWIAMQQPEEQLDRVKEAYTVQFGSGGDFVLLIVK